VPRIRSPHYKWIALTNTTLGVFMAAINASITLISLPAIFRGIHLNPLTPGNVSYLLWMLMGYLLVTAVLVVSLGRLGDMKGRVKIYNAGFAIFSVASVALALDPMKGAGGALFLIVWRLVQGVGAAMLFANSTAIITDAFPTEQRGTALGINQVAAIAGSFIGLIAGGLLSQVDWRLVFFVSVPVGVLGTIWAYVSLRDNGRRVPAHIDWVGNVTFAVGLTAVLAGITYGIQPYGGHPQGWTNPLVLVGLIGGVAMLVAFCLLEVHVAEPMFNLRLFRNRSFAAGNATTLLASISRGGLQFMLIIWLQGIWLPLHGYNFTSTPLWAGIYLLPLTGGFLVAGPLSGFLSDRHGARTISTAGLLVSAVSFVGLVLLPVNFGYLDFALLIALNGIGMGMFAAPNTTAVMNSVPAEQRGGAGGMSATFQNAGMVLSIGVFFSLMVTGLSSTLPRTLTSGLTSHGVAHGTAVAIGNSPPVGSLFAAFLGYNPLKTLLGTHLSSLSAANRATLTGKRFFPQLLSGPFHHGLVIVFVMAGVMLVAAAIVSALRGERYIHQDSLPMAARLDGAEEITEGPAYSAQVAGVAAGLASPAPHEAERP
jgi:MFS family permease